jgi:hypothetical protein
MDTFDRGEEDGVSVHDIDNRADHLYPAFRDKLNRVLTAVALKTGGPWRIAEGFRSNERQLWLYASGRTRPGPWLTSMRTPKHHGSGLAADCYPKDAADFKDHASYEAFRQCWQAEGLENPAWSRQDYGHVQWPAADLTTHRKALAWVRAGFKPVTPQPTEIPVHVGADLIEDADAYRDPATGRVYVALRPVTDALGYAIAEVRDRQALVVDDDGEMTVPAHTINGRGFAWSRDLSELAAITWDPAKGLTLADR